MRNIRGFAICGISVASLWLILCMGVGIFLTEGALHPGRLELTESNKAFAQRFALSNHAVLTDVAIVANDGVELRGWSIRPIRGSEDVVLLLHGQSDNRSGMLGAAEMLLSHGYAVVLPDARAHGMSGGKIATYGVIEAEDVRAWFRWVEVQQHPRCVDAIGDSMGGAQILSALAKEPKFCAVVAESAFATFEEAAFDRLGQAFRAGPWLGRTLLRPAVEAGLVYAKIRYGINLREASPEITVSKTIVPVLLIHGLADTNLPPRHSEMIRAQNERVALWEPVGVGHCGAAGVAPAEYETRVVNWFKTHEEVVLDGNSR
jgi:uncharacterized protein